MDGEVIVVALNANEEITAHALEWAAQNVLTKVTDFLLLLAVLPLHQPRASAADQASNFFLSCLPKKCCLRNWQRVKNSTDKVDPVHGVHEDKYQQIHDACAHLMRQLCLKHNNKVHTQVKVLAEAEMGSVAEVARKLEATWVILDRHLMKEGDSCLRQLNCNIVIIDHALSKVLRAVNPVSGKKHRASRDQSDWAAALANHSIFANNSGTTQSSLGIESPSSDTDASCSLPRAEKEPSQNSSPSSNNSKFHSAVLHLDSNYFHDEVDSQTTFSTSPPYSKSWTTRMGSSSKFGELPLKSPANLLDSNAKACSGVLRMNCAIEKVNSADVKSKATFRVRRSTGSIPCLQGPESSYWLSHPISRMHSLTYGKEEELEYHPSSAVERTSSLRRAISLTIKHRPTPPPLCSVCKHNTPIFGRAPMRFNYQEIEAATDGFLKDNLLAEGGSGSVYRGTLPDGQIVAVKQYKTMSAQGASEFCAEVEVLGCTQHRNLVMLVGYCIETEWLLVYEFACNGSLDKHLYGDGKDKVMAWHDRMKVAIGAARGLQYLHEDCRVGCIVHRDFRPNNILLTHDFEPMVGDFGLARWQADGQSAEETRVIGAFGYVAPEYTQTGLITEKADVYAFGVVLLELLCGTKAVDFSRNTGLQFVIEWGYPLLKRNVITEIIDPRLEQTFVEKEVQCMMCAAILCLSPNPEERPRMSEVLKLLEGDAPAYFSTNSGQHSSNYPKHEVSNMYNTETPLMETVYQRPPSIKSVHQLNKTPSRKNVHRNNGSTSSPKTLASPNDSKVGTGIWERNQPKVDASGEYQSYLQGSLARFTRDLTMREKTN